jgi:hypothetical protein
MGFSGSGMGMGGGRPPLPIGDPRRPMPKGREPRDPRRVGGKWDEGAVEQDWPMSERTKKVMTDVQGAIQAIKDVSFKKRLRKELEQVGWEYNRGATFMANFLFRSKYMIFDFLIIKGDILDIYRIKVVTGRDGISGYKLMKWVL